MLTGTSQWDNGMFDNKGYICFYSNSVNIFVPFRRICNPPTLLFFIQQCAWCRIKLLAETAGEILGVIKAYFIRYFSNIHLFCFPVFEE
jgi:hypothetical protein